MAISNHTPDQFTVFGERTRFAYNIIAHQVADIKGKVHTQYEYDEVYVIGNVTKEKLMCALMATDYSIEEELGKINDYLSDNVKYASDYAEYHQYRAACRLIVIDALVGHIKK